jgi:hypothetical protein
LLRRRGSPTLQPPREFTAVLIEPRDVVQSRLAASRVPHPSPLWPSLYVSPTVVQFISALEVGGDGVENTPSLVRGEAVSVAQKPEALSSAPARETAAIGRGV